MITPGGDAIDLLAEKLLQNAPRVMVEGKTYPALGGIPLLKKIGQGGMAAVYYSVHPRLKTELAIKVMPYQLASDQDDTVSRFYREAQLAANIRSPHLVHVSDVNEQSGLFYLVMEYVNGLSAGAYCRMLNQAGKKGLDEAVALEICMAASEGLCAAHAESVVHRDIKPDNILIPRTKDGTGLQCRKAKLADLGLARDESSDQSITMSHHTVGTPGFMAPEQALSSKKACKQSDVFSMGATLYALLCGEPPFMGESQMATVLATIQTPHVKLSKLRTGISGNTEILIDRCLEKDPLKRYADAAALLQVLKAARAAYRAPAAHQSYAPIATPARGTPSVTGKPGSGPQTPAPPIPAPIPPSGSGPRNVAVSAPPSSGTRTPVPGTLRTPPPLPPGPTRSASRTPPAMAASPFRAGASPYVPEVRRLPPMARRDDDLASRIEAHVRKFLGEPSRLLNRGSAPVVHIDVLHVKPTRERNFHIVVTSGMSQKPMPTSQGTPGHDFAEIMACLPPEWALDENSLKDAANYWPVRWLMQLARMPYEDKVRIFRHNTIGNGNPPVPLSSATQLNCLWMVDPTLLPAGFTPVKITQFRTIHFLCVMPIFREERTFKQTQGAAALLERLKQNRVTELFNLQRRSVV